ncbi:MAG TPA: DNA-3-methyladenine glycosylase I, partial [Bacteroidota bacterium]|nr:DNA-3-methyladenine glycosylase I [Bacteroidota bacterium]
QYGFPLLDDNELLGRLILEINQAGLNWTIMLKKQKNFRLAYDNFDVEKIARYKERDINRLLADAGIIRNNLKIRAAIHNANVIQGLQKEHGSFKHWLDAQTCGDLGEWTKLFKKTFKFTGGEIVNEFLMSTGYLPNAHAETCPVYKKILKQKPKWAQPK